MWLFSYCTYLCRDLAEQTHKCFQAYGKCLQAPGLSSVLLVGGLDAAAQLKALKAGAEIVVGTPGRVMDFVETGKLPLSKVSVCTCGSDVRVSC